MKYAILILSLALLACGNAAGQSTNTSTQNMPNSRQPRNTNSTRTSHSKKATHHTTHKSTTKKTQKNSSDATPSNMGR